MEPPRRLIEVLRVYLTKKIMLLQKESIQKEGVLRQDGKATPITTELDCLSLSMAVLDNLWSDAADICHRRAPAIHKQYHVRILRPCSPFLSFIYPVSGEIYLLRILCLFIL